MNTLVILSILIGHLWTDQAQASDDAKAMSDKQKPTVKGLITNAAIPKLKQQPTKDNQSSVAKSAQKKSSASAKAPSDKVVKKAVIPTKKHVAKPAEHVQKLIPLEPSKPVEKKTLDQPAPGVKKTAPDNASIKETSSDKEAPVKDKQKPDEKLEVSIDTVGIEAGGNWLSKRVWYEHAQDALQEIANELSNILATRQQYLTARDSLDNKFEEAFIELGFDQGKLASMLDHLLDSLKQEQEKQGDLSADERKLRLNIEKQQKDLEQLKLDLESLKNLDDSLDAAVKRVMEQINLAGMYNKEAHSYFDQIPNVHEQRAKELYYKIDTLHKDMLAIKAYLTGQLSDYLKQVESSATMHIAKIKSEVAAIQAKGLDFKKQLRVLEGEDESADAKAMADKEVEEAEEPGFFGRIWNQITDFLNSIWSWLTGWF